MKLRSKISRVLSLSLSLLLLLFIGYGCDGGSSSSSSSTGGCNGGGSGGSGAGSDYDTYGDGLFAVTRLEKQNPDSKSVLYRKCNTAKVAAGGHSLGSIGTFAIASDARLTTTIHVSGGSFNGRGPDIEAAGEAGNGQLALAAIVQNEYDVVLLDLSLPDMDGLDVLRNLQNKKPKLPVLILSIYSEEQYALRVLKNGAIGYLTKESVPSDLIRAIRKAFRGERYISDTLAERLANRFTGDEDRHPHELLSNREQEVFRMIASGKPIKEISNEMSVARTTVTSYRGRILEKRT